VLRHKIWQLVTLSETGGAQKVVYYLAAKGNGKPDSDDDRLILLGGEVKWMPGKTRIW